MRVCTGVFLVAFTTAFTGAYVAMRDVSPYVSLRLLTSRRKPLRFLTLLTSRRKPLRLLTFAYVAT